MKKMLIGLMCLSGLYTGCGVSREEGPVEVKVSWSLEQGDCASHNVEKVRVYWGEREQPSSAEFACTDGKGSLGTMESGTPLKVWAEGLTADGKDMVYLLSLQTTVRASLNPNKERERTIDFALRVKPRDVTVTWADASGNTCPPQITLNYEIRLKDAAGESTLKKVQAPCKEGTAKINSVDPGEYMIEVDSQAGPSRGTRFFQSSKKVTIEPGVDPKVHVGATP